MRNPNHLPLRIEWKLATPWSPCARGLHLDGLLAFAVVDEAKEQGISFDSFDDVIKDLPLGVYRVGDAWVWQASMIAAVEVRGVERRYMTAKTSSTAFAERMTDGRILGRPLTSIDTVRGPYKNDAFWFTLENVEQCVAWCIGDPDRIATLLDRIPHLGKRGAQDCGRIARFDVFEDDVAEVNWRLRPMPESEESYVPVVGRLNPPYWMGEGETTVWVPNT